MTEWIITSYLSWESTEESIPEVAQCKCKVLVEKIPKNTQFITFTDNDYNYKWISSFTAIVHDQCQLKKFEYYFQTLPQKFAHSIIWPSAMD